MRKTLNHKKKTIHFSIASILLFLIFALLATLPIIAIIAGLGASAYNSKSIFWQLMKLMYSILLSEHGLPLYYGFIILAYIIGNIIIVIRAKKRQK